MNKKTSRNQGESVRGSRSEQIGTQDMKSEQVCLIQDGVDPNRILGYQIFLHLWLILTTVLLTVPIIYG